MFKTWYAGNIAYTGYLGGYQNGGASRLRIMKGAVPTNFDSLTTDSSRSSDVLVSWTLGEILSTSYITTTDNTVTLTTPYTTASVGGVASWFWLYAYNDGTGVIINQFLGNITGLGFGGDLEVANTTVTAGQQYRVTNLRIQFPGSWTY